MASPRLKRKLPDGQRDIMVMGSASGSYSPHRSVFSISPPEPSQRDDRKRRKDMLSRVKHTLTPYFDGHSWRKYGEKTIKDSPFPRLYFRCSYNEDRHCLASKLVQQENDDEPPLFKVTYTYEHTCNTAPVPVPSVVAAAVPPAARDGFVLSFGSSGGGGHHYDARARMLQEWQQCPQPSAASPSPFFMMNFDSSSKDQLHRQSAFLPATAAASSSSSFEIVESSSLAPPPATAAASSCPLFEKMESSLAPPSTNDECRMFATTWEQDSFRYSLDDCFHVDDHARFPGDSYSSEDSGGLFSWEETDGCSLALDHLLTRMEADGLIF